MTQRVKFPLVDRPAGSGPLLSRYQLTLKAVSLVRINSVWTEVEYPAQDLILSVGPGNFFIGGQDYVMSDAAAAATGLPPQYLEVVP